MGEDTLLTAVALVVLAVSLATGPLRLAVRSVLRAGGGRNAIRRHTAIATPALCTGSLGAVAVAGMLFGGGAAITAALIALLLLMIAMDLAWRWLPIEWTLAALCLGLTGGLIEGQPLEAVLGAAVGGGLLFALRAGFQILRGVEALGLGDVWLAAALGAFVGPALIGWLLGSAAALGLVLHLVSAFSSRPNKRARYGVAYGAHLATLAPLFLTF